MTAPRLPRRRILAGATLLAAAALGRPGRAAAAAMVSAFPEGAELLVGGPASGRTAEWGRLLAPLLEQGLPLTAPLRQDPVGGADGVTAANQFEARTTPDGATALLLPGSAALLWLVGDPRAKFDVAHWVPGLAGIGSGVIASRLPLGRLAAGTPVRFAASTPNGPELPGLLAIELLGLRLVPVFGIGTERRAGMRWRMAWWMRCSWAGATCRSLCRHSPPPARCRCSAWAALTPPGRGSATRPSPPC